MMERRCLPCYTPVPRGGEKATGGGREILSRPVAPYETHGDDPPSFGYGIAMSVDDFPLTTFPAIDLSNP